MRVYHPNAVRETVDDVDDGVQLRGELISVADDGTLDVSERQAEELAGLYDLTVDDIRVDDGEGSDDADAWAESLADEHWQTVVSEIESGDVDDLLDDLEAIDDRPSVQSAINERRDDLSD